MTKRLTVAERLSPDVWLLEFITANGLHPDPELGSYGVLPERLIYAAAAACGQESICVDYRVEGITYRYWRLWHSEETLYERFFSSRATMLSRRKRKEP